jgi:palmitoyltransferase
MARCSNRVLSVLAAAARGLLTGLGCFTIFMACVLISDVLYTMPAIVIPTIFEAGIMRYVHLVVFAYVSFGVFFNYYLAAGTDPGLIPSDFIEYADTAVDRVSYCGTCKLPRPERCHHCSLCGRCVLKMDHHCPWINGCVGYHNQRYFFCFLLYLLSGTTYCGIMLSHLYWFHAAASTAKYEPVSRSVMITFTFVLVGSIFLAMVFFVGWNGYMLLTNQTAIEFHGNSAQAKYESANSRVFRSPFDLGRLPNIIEVVGDAPLRLWIPFVGRVTITGRQGGWLGMLWLLAPTLQPMPGDGTAYPTWDDESATHSYQV